MKNRLIKVLIIESKSPERKILRDIFNKLSNTLVIGTANSKKTALVKIFSLNPDLITLDLYDKNINGLEILKKINYKKNFKVLIISKIPNNNMIPIIRALELGAFDFINRDNNIERFKKTIKKKIQLLSSVIFPYKISKKKSEKPTTKLVKNNDIISSLNKIDIIVIGASTGGPAALSRIIPFLPKDLGIPIIIVQHLPPFFTKILADSLDRKSKLIVKEAENLMYITPNIVYIAPGGKQIKLEKKDYKVYIKITDDPPENNCKPSIDYLCRSIAPIYKDRALGIIMTGMGNDGVKGMKMMKENGAKIIAQNKSTSVVFGMPLEAIKSGIVDIVLPLEKIPEEIIKIVLKKESITYY